jgi:hypothetical protein
MPFSGNPKEALQMKYLFRETRRRLYKRNIFFGKPEGGFTNGMLFFGTPDGGLRKDKQLFCLNNLTMTSCFGMVALYF